MKIDKSSLNRHRGESLTVRKSSVSVSPKNGSMADLKSLPVQKNLKNDLLVLLGKLKHQFAGFKVPGNSFSPEGFASLSSFINLLESAGTEPGSRDLVLAGKFLSGWIGKYGGDVSGPAAKALGELDKFLHNLNSRTSVSYFVSGQVLDGKADWRLVSERGEDGTAASREKEGSHELRLDVSTASLGEISVNLIGNEDMRECCFLSSDPAVRKILKKNMVDFETQLKNHGVELPRLSVLKSNQVKDHHEKPQSDGIDLWG